MKAFGFILIGIAICVVLGIVGIAALAYWGFNQKIDLSDPAIAASFKQGVEQSCFDGASQAAVIAGKPFSEADNVRQKRICGCSADEMLANFQKNGGFKVADMVSDPKARSELQGITQACEQKLGAQ